MTPAQLADRLVADDDRTREAVARAERALAAWSSFPRSTRAAFPREARRLALRAAVALLSIPQAAQEHHHATR
jgi:hypothetical protein